MPKTILVVDDDPHIREVVVFALDNAGMTTSEAIDGAHALKTAEKHAYDLIVLDINMPELDGLEVCKELRKTSEVPILFLSSRDEEIDRIIGLELGADDYLTKPFSTRELVARVKAILKRTQAATSTKNKNNTISCGALKIETEKHICSWNGKNIDLTATEFSILAGMAAQPDRVFDRDQIMTMAYGINISVSDRTIDSHIRHIRKKLSQIGCDKLITTMRGVGYKLTP
jgi:two-component system OmpR family response regulator